MTNLDAASLRKAIASRMGRSLASIGWRLPLARLIAPSRLVVLIYHSVPPTGDGNSVDAAVFERHIVFLKENFQFISPREIEVPRRRMDCTEVLLTFDDGMRNNFDVVWPVLTKHGIPGLFFISSRHAEPGRYLWFVYLRALKKYFPRDRFFFRGTHVDMRAPLREESVARLTDQLLEMKPHPGAMYEAIEHELPALRDFMTPQRLRDECEGIRAEEIATLGKNELFSIGCHTVDHPFLARCEPKEARRQIEDNKCWLETVSGIRCDAVAYPSGDYNAEVLALCRESGFLQGYAVSPALRSAPELEIPRVGVYSASLEILGFKVQWGNLLRAARVSFG